eukprot:3068440-Amphidinium_carterae.1
MQRTAIRPYVSRSPRPKRTTQSPKRAIDLSTRLGSELLAPDPEPFMPPFVEVTNLPAAPLEIGPHRRVVEHDNLAQCLDCSRQVRFYRGRFNFHYLRGRIATPCEKPWVLLLCQNSMCRFSPAARAPTSVQLSSQSH